MADQMVLEIPKVIHECVIGLAKHIKMMRSLACAPEPTVNYELEARFGSVSNGHFVPGVPPEMAHTMLAMLQSYSDWDRQSEDWVESHDYFYTHNDQRVRTSVRFHPDEGIRTQHLIKTPLGKVTMGFPQAGPLLVRAAIQQEQEVNPKLVPNIVNPDFVRIKQRRSFVKGCWAFEMTRCWEGKTREAAEAKQVKDDTVYEFEVECIRPSEYFQKEYHTDEYIATSLLMKMKDFLPADYDTSHMCIQSS